MPGRKFHRRSPLNRRTFLKSTMALAGASLCGGVWAAKAPPKPMNVVLFVVDDMGWMDSSVYGSRYYETPNLERLARTAIRFTDAYSAAPLCTATRASILTGNYPGRLHITGASGHVPARPGPLLPEKAPAHQKMLSPRCQGFLPLEEYTLAEALHDAGYRTAHIGKWHLGHDEQYWPEHQGFEVNIGGGRWPGPPSYFAPYHIDNLPDGPEGEYIADRLTDEAIRFIEEAGEAPFFLNFWQYAVHAPYQCKPEYRAYFEQKQDPRGAQDNAVMGAMIKSMDESLGRVLDALEARGLAQRTIFIFTSDNGGNMYDRTARDGTNYGAWAPEGRTPTNNAPLRSGKGSLYEGGVRVPALVRWPGVADSEAVSHEVISSIDLYPTLLAMLDIAPKPGKIFDGISIVPALMGRSLGREAIFSHFPHAAPAVPMRQASWVRRGDWKLIRFYELDENFPNRLELYNLREDIGELENRVEQEPARARDLERMLDHHLEQTGALVPKENPYYRPEAATEVGGWRPSGDAWLEPGPGALTMHSIGPDPYIVCGAIPALPGALRIEMRLRSSASGTGQFFWATAQGRQFGPGRRLDFAPPPQRSMGRACGAFRGRGPAPGHPHRSRRGSRPDRFRLDSPDE